MLKKRLPKKPRSIGKLKLVESFLDKHKNIVNMLTISISLLALLVSFLVYYDSYNERIENKHPLVFDVANPFGSTYYVGQEISFSVDVYNPTSQPILLSGWKLDKVDDWLIIVPPNVVPQPVGMQTLLKEMQNPVPKVETNFSNKLKVGAFNSKTFYYPPVKPTREGLHTIAFCIFYDKDNFEQCKEIKISVITPLNLTELLR